MHGTFKKSEIRMLGRYIKPLFWKIYSLTPEIIKISARSLWHLRFHSKIIRPQDWHFPESWPLLSNPVLIIGHANFLNSTGGTELAIINHAESLLSTDETFVYICPTITSPSTPITRSKVFQVIINGHHFGTIPLNQLYKFVEKIAPKKIEIHHILRWPLRALTDCLINYKGPVRIFYHDFLWKCPLINNRCANGDRLCKRKYTKRYMNYWKTRMKIISDRADMIVVPSKFVFEQLDGSQRMKAQIHPPGAFANTDHAKPTLAFLGYAAELKGYETWKKITENALITRAVDLIHIGQRPYELNGVPNYSYTFSQTKTSSAVKILQEQGVTAVLLWSQVPETYSFTLHEALAAGCQIITSSRSGNIAYTIKNDLPTQGIILDNDYQLTYHLLKNFKRPKADI